MTAHPATLDIAAVRKNSVEIVGRNGLTIGILLLPLDGQPCWPVSPRKGFLKPNARFVNHTNGVPLGSNVAMPDLGRHQSTDSNSSLVAKLLFWP
jgi:hypothetical protein